MSQNLNKSQVARFSRQIILKNIGALGQKKIIQSKVLIIGMGGLGCSVAEFLTRAGVGSLGIIDFDNVDITNIHRQSLYDVKDIKKSKVIVAKKKLRKINSNTKVNCYKVKLNESNIKNITSKYDYIIDGSDNFKTKFLVNDYCKKTKKFLVVGAISKFDGHIFTFNFKNKKDTCLKCFYQSEPSDDILNCEYEGILGPVAGIVGNIQAIEILKMILNLNKKSNNKILILDLLNLKFRLVKLKKRNNCLCR